MEEVEEGEEEEWLGEQAREDGEAGGERPGSLARTSVKPLAAGLTSPSGLDNTSLW